MTGKTVETGGDLLIYVQSPVTPDVRAKYDWSVRLGVVGGGLLPVTEDFEQMYQAPADGYNIEYNAAYAKDDPRWITTYNGVFYLMSRDSRCYGKISIEVLSYQAREGKVMLIMDSYVNPRGSRNLEVDPKLVTAAN